MIRAFQIFFSFSFIVAFGASVNYVLKPKTIVEEVIVEEKVIRKIKRSSPNNSNGRSPASTSPVTHPETNVTTHTSDGNSADFPSAEPSSIDSARSSSPKNMMYFLSEKNAAGKSRARGDGSHPSGKTGPSSNRRSSSGMSAAFSNLPDPTALGTNSSPSSTQNTTTISEGSNSNSYLKISGNTNLIMNEDTTGSLTFNIESSFALACNLQDITVSSSDLLLLPMSGINLSGGKENCQLQLSPVANAFGEVRVGLLISKSGHEVEHFVDVTVNTLADDAFTEMIAINALTFSGDSFLLNQSSDFSAYQLSGMIKGESSFQIGVTADCDPNVEHCSELNSHWTPQWSSLIGYWKLNETTLGSVSGNDFRDESLNGFHGIKNGNMIYGLPAKVSNGIDFGGSSYFEVADDDGLTPGRNFTLSAWVKMKPSTDTSMVICKWNQDIQDEYALVINPDGKLNLSWHTVTNNSWGSSAFNGVNSTSAITWYTWNHIVGVKQGAWVHFYINGINAGSSQVADDNPIRNGTATLRIGAEARNGVNRFVNGAVDEVAIWNTSLTGPEISAIYQRQTLSKGSPQSGLLTSPVLTKSAGTNWDALGWDPGNKGEELSPSETISSGLVGLWHLDSTVTDSSSSANHGTVVGSTSFVTSPFATAPSFAGADTNYIRLDPAKLPRGNSPRSVSFWFKQESAGSRTIFSYGKNAGGELFEIMSYNGGLILHAYGGSQDTIEVIAPVELQRWHHGVISYNGTSVKIYVNGEYAGSKNLSLNTGSTFAKIGGTGYFNGFTGKVDEVGVWNRELSPEEVSSLYHRGAGGVFAQVRTCLLADCSDGVWSRSLSRLDLLEENSPYLKFSQLSGFSLLQQPYLQYQLIIDNNQAVKEALVSTSDGQPMETSLLLSPISLLSMNQLTEMVGPYGCSNNLRYSLSTTSSDWRYWNGSDWIVSDGTYNQSNETSIINSQLASFPQEGEIYIKVSLKSDGIKPCSLRSLTVDGIR